MMQAIENFADRDTPASQGAVMVRPIRSSQAMSPADTELGSV
ncbi:hypothetical protein [Nonomuraea zeae]